MTEYGSLPLNYFKLSGERFRYLESQNFKYYDEEVLNPTLLNTDFDTTFISFHYPGSDEEISIMKNRVKL